MVDEMAALHSTGTWDLVVLPFGKFSVGCRWVYTVKVGPDGQVDRLKARLVAKGYTQVYGSTISSVSLPKNTNEALSHPGWRQAMVDEMAALHSTGTWDLVVLPFGKFQLVVVGFTQLKLVLMVRLIALRLAWLLKDILRFMVLIMVTPSPPLPRLLLSVCFSPWLLCVSGHFFSWILKMSSFMVILPRKFIWSNHPVLLLRGGLV